MKFEIITRCTRPENLIKLRASIVSNFMFDYKWKIFIDTSKVSNLNSFLLSELHDDRTSFFFIEGKNGDFGHALLNRAIDLADENSWLYFLDDDNLLHPDLFTVASKELENSHYEAFVFSQKICKPDFTGLEIRTVSKDKIKVQEIDMAQFLIKKSLIKEERFKSFEYKADGYFIENIYEENNDCFLITDKILCYYNAISEDVKKWFLPRILLVETENETASTSFINDHESTELNIIKIKDDEVSKILNEFDPDAIVTSGINKIYKQLGSQSLDIRRKWINVDNENSIGDASYACSMNYILRNETDDLVSIITPFFNTGEKLLRTYESVKNQNYTNWEWILWNDGSDNTINIANKIAKLDSRVKVYDIFPKSKGIIGKVKHEAFMLARGKYLIELDHDDYLLSHALNELIKAFQKFPEAKFVYSDCAEVNENLESLSYGDGFSFGYGHYRIENILGKEIQVAIASGVNPKTIRHIVGVPNHFRAWERDFYKSIGGHNRRLSIADDYELIVRTFLNTKMVHIPKCCYLQFFHENNSQDSSRADIQRRVRTISGFYHEKIKLRFEELGVEDWAYERGLGTESKFGKEECNVNLIYDEK